MELLLEDAQSGRVYNLSPAATDLTWETSRRPSAGRVELCYCGPFYPEGSLLQFAGAEGPLFQGRLFESSQSRDGRVRAVFYDQLRYLKAQDVIVRKEMTLGELVNAGCAAFGLRVGELEDSRMRLPKKIYDNKEWLSALEDSIREQNYLSGQLYCLYDAAGAVNLLELEALKLPLVLGDGSLVYDWERSRSITEAANRVKFLDATNGGIYQYQDSGTLHSWGALQHFEKLSGYNREQLDKLGKSTLATKNRVGQTFSISALGDSRVRGGSGIKVALSSLSVQEWMVVEKAVHSWSGGQYTMKLELGVRE